MKSLKRSAEPTRHRSRMSLAARSILTAGIVGAGTLAGVAAPASALGGGTLDNNPAVVSLGGGRCTGVQISESAILTAAHCAVPRAGFFHVQGDGWYDLASSSFVDRLSKSAAGDVQIAHLETPHPLPSYPRVNLNYKPVNGQTGVIYGAGIPNALQQRTTAVTVVDSGEIIAGGPTVKVNHPGAYTASGDSGGPLFVDGAVVGVLYGSYGDADSWYSLVSSTENAALIASELGNAIVGNRSTTPYQWEFRNAASGQALGVSYDYAVPNQTSVLRTFTGSQSQQWALKFHGDHLRLVNRTSQLVLGIYNGSKNTGAPAVLTTETTSTDQDWDVDEQPDGSYIIRNVNSGQVLVPQGLSTSPDAPLVQAPAQGDAAEKWQRVQVG